LPLRGHRDCWLAEAREPQSRYWEAGPSARPLSFSRRRTSASPSSRAAISPAKAAARKLLQQLADRRSRAVPKLRHQLSPESGGRGGRGGKYSASASISRASSRLAFDRLPAREAAGSMEARRSVTSMPSSFWQSCFGEGQGREPRQSGDPWRGSQFCSPGRETSARRTS
jgi:hypothetical protein